MSKLSGILSLWLAASTLLAVPPAVAFEADSVIAAIDARRDRHAAIIKQIWDYAEVGYQEYKTTALHQKTLKEAGFSIETGVAGLPTAFIASFGQGGPVIALLAEIDALPGITQAVSPVRSPLPDKKAGHACGHHMFGTGSVAAAIAVKEWLESSGTAGTVRVYGTPAEEGGSGKVYMVREGLFEDVDVVLHWHPGDRNDASPTTSLANKSAKFRFHGISSHAAGAPERGRSALDGVEAMNHMVNMMREHVPEKARMHYVITHGGEAPNVVPDFAEVYYYVRHPEVEVLEELWERVVKTAEGAALGTGTTMDFEVMHGNRSLLPNDTLARIMDRNLRRVGGITYSAEEQEFAEALVPSLGRVERQLGSEAHIQPYEPRAVSGSTDVGDVSWVVPTAGLNAATWVPGTSAHSWQAIAAGGMSIGVSGTQVAAKTLALTAIELFAGPDRITDAKRELADRRGEDFEYHALLGDRAPPLDYRN